MAKLGYAILEPEPGILAWDGKKGAAMENIAIDTYDDHRMALAFAPAALIYPGIVIKNAEVVTKSYPQYWEQMQAFGMKMEEIK
jgi:3-phosphoshikimate 1-carboxyvinyltransferase